MKPRLPRKITSTARINLNQYWNELEEEYTRREKCGRGIEITDNLINEGFSHQTAFEMTDNYVNEQIQQSLLSPAYCESPISSPDVSTDQSFDFDSSYDSGFDEVLERSIVESRRDIKNVRNGQLHFNFRSQPGGS